MSMLNTLPNMAFSFSLENLLDCPWGDWEPPHRSDDSSITAVLLTCHLKAPLPCIVALTYKGHSPIPAGDHEGPLFPNHPRSPLQIIQPRACVHGLGRWHGHQVKWRLAT